MRKGRLSLGPSSEDRYAIVVAGGGPSGVAAAMAASSSGARTLLIERSGRLGGMGTIGMGNQIPLMTDTHYDIPFGCLVPERTDGLLLAGRTWQQKRDRRGEASQVAAA